MVSAAECDHVVFERPEKNDRALLEIMRLTLRRAGWARDGLPPRKGSVSRMATCDMQG